MYTCKPIHYVHLYTMHAPLHLYIYTPIDAFVQLNTCTPLYISTLVHVHPYTCTSIYARVYTQNICTPVPPCTLQLYMCPPKHLYTCTAVHSCTLIYFYTCAPINLYTYTLIHLYICTLKQHLYTVQLYLLVQPFTCTLMQLYTYILVPPYICTPTHPYICTLIRLYS